MIRPASIHSAIFGAGLGVPLLAIMYLGWQAARLPFAPFDLFGLVVRVLPGAVVNAALEMIVGGLQTWRLGDTDDLAKSLQAAMAVALLLVVLAALGALHDALARRLSVRAAARGAATGFSLWLLLVPGGLLAGWNLGGLLWTLALCMCWGTALICIARQWAALSQSPVDAARRNFLTQLGIGLVALTALGLGLGRGLKRPEATAASPGAVPAPSDGFTPVEGTRPEVTSLPDFYRVDIKLDPPRLDANTWRLELRGAVERPVTLSYTNLTTLPSESFYATLECISNRVGGDLISTTLFTGVALRDVLALARPNPGTAEIKFVCADGYSESLPLEAALDPDTRLCYAMGGAALLPEHGFPVRLFAPHRYGMKNPKWITKIEAVADDYLGFWEQRGWSDAAWVRATSVIDVARSIGAGELEAGGIAYAGARGISKVEVRVGEGDWAEAELKSELSPLTWVVWRVTLKAGPGQHRLIVRATDGMGKLQSTRTAEAFPNGATGYHKITVRVEQEIMQ